MNIALQNLNFLAILVSSVVSFIIGAVWFGPKTFYPVSPIELWLEIGRAHV